MFSGVYLGSHTFLSVITTLEYEELLLDIVTISPSFKSSLSVIIKYCIFWLVFPLSVITTGVVPEPQLEL